MWPDVISILFPSRGRPAQAEASAAGLLDLAACPEAVEILIAADPDDGPTLALAASVPPQVRLWTAPHRYGYGHLHEYYNTLAGMATGQWLMLWNDDAYMQTPGWDDIIREQKPGVVWGIPCNPAASPGDPSEFPAIPAAWFRHVGHLCLAMQIDSWINEIAQRTGTGRVTGIRIFHERTYDQTYAEQDHPGEFGRADMAAAREADAAKIMELAG